MSVFYLKSLLYSYENKSVLQQERICSHSKEISSKVTELSQPKLDKNRELIWTVKTFDFGVEHLCTREFAKVLNPISSSNHIVTTIWSKEFATAIDHDSELLIHSMKNVGRSLKRCHFKDTAQHVLNGLVIGLMMCLNLQGGNLLKGLVGTTASLIKLALRPFLFLSHLIVAIKLLCSGAKEQALQHLEKALTNLCALPFVDLLNTLSCIGLMIPFWLPLVLLIACPPVGLVVGALKLLSQFTGIFDVIGYGGTAILLWGQKKWAERKIEKGGLSLQSEAKAQEVLVRWKELQNKLHPFKSPGGAFVVAAGLNMVLQGGVLALDVFVPGAGKIAQYGAYALAAMVGGGCLVQGKRNQEKALAAPSKTADAE